MLFKPMSARYSQKALENRRKYSLEYYRKHKGELKEKRKTNSVKIKAASHQSYLKRKAWYDALKLSLKCSRCSFSHPAAMDFHHRDPSVKDKRISVNRFMSKTKYLLEMEKCDVLCSNCHRIVHYDLRNDARVTIEDYGKNI